MTTTHAPRRFRTRSVLSVVASCAVLATTAVLTPALLSSANASAPSSTVTDHERSEPLAHRVVHRDARRDVFVYNLENDTSRAVPRNRTTDIRRTVVDHRAKQLLVRTQVRQLSRSGYRLMVGEILASDGRRYELLVDYSVRPIGPRISLTRAGSAADVHCPGASWSITRSTGRVEAVIPNSCLKDPDWVRIGVGLVSSPRNLSKSWADDSRTRGRVGEHLLLGPRQPRA